MRFFAERRQSIGSYVNVRFFGAYGPYEAPRKITTKWLSAIRDGQREFVIRGNTIKRGDLQVLKNTGPVEQRIEGNTGGGRLLCRGNSLPAVSANSGWKRKLGKCS